MPYSPNNHHRRSIRLKGYDYAQAGLYFTTICAQNRACLFGNIVNEKMMLNDAGKMITHQWANLKTRFTNIELHEYVVMPNHFHAIFEIVGAPPVGASLVDALVDARVTVPQNNDNAQNGQPTEIGQPPMGGNGQPQPTDNRQPQPTQNGQPQPTQNGQPQPTQNGQPLVVAQNGQPQGVAPTGKTVGDMMAAFKSITTVEYIRGVKNSGWLPFDGKLWQRNYWEHIIRNENEYQRIAQYIINNPSKWENDKLNTGDGNRTMDSTTTRS